MISTRASRLVLMCSSAVPMQTLTEVAGKTAQKDLEAQQELTLLLDTASNTAFMEMAESVGTKENTATRENASREARQMIRNGAEGERRAQFLHSLVAGMEATTARLMSKISPVTGNQSRLEEFEDAL